MQILNLANLSESHIKYEKIKYPDGQQDLFIDTSTVAEGEVVDILSRFNSFLDLELIICATRSLRNSDVSTIKLTIPYLLGARSDRKFREGGVSYLVQVVAPIINSLNFNKVYCLDAHSNVAAACIDRLVSVSNAQFVIEILKGKDNYFLVSPDAGAKEKVFNIAKALHYPHDIIVCSKKRDIQTGRILETNIGNVTDLRGVDVYIVDDICDGGRTFIEIAKKLKLRNPGKMNLIITHGIFSSGYDVLEEHFDNVYCTNSVSDIVGQETLINQTKVI